MNPPTLTVTGMVEVTSPTGQRVPLGLATVTVQLHPPDPLLDLTRPCLPGPHTVVLGHLSPQPKRDSS